MAKKSMIAKAKREPKFSTANKGELPGVTKSSW